MPRNTASSVATIDQFLTQLGTTKQADAPKSEAGSIGGETEHPVKSVDDRLKEVKEGERFKENTKDVNEDQGAASVQKAPEATAKSAAASTIFGLASRFAKKAEGGAVSTPGSAADDHISTTTTVSATGEDPKNETGSAKAGKEDKEQGGMGGTSHPASTENNSIDGHKWAADTPLEKLSADMSKVGNTLLTLLHGVYQQNGQQPPQATKQAAAQAPQQASPIAFQAGHELAGLVNGTFDKRAADAMVHTALTQTIKQASDDADLFVHFANNFFKQAEGEAEGSEEAGGGGGGEDPMAAMGGGGGDPMAGGGGGGDPGAMLGALGGGAGADPAGGMGGGGGGEGGDAEAQQLAMILEQLGVTPEELQAAMEAEAAGGGGGGGMGGGGGDPMAAMGGGGAGGGAPPGGGMETQASAGGRKTNISKQAASEMGNYIRELANRSRFKK